jgi:peptide/nickel transport system permease protein
MTVRIGRRVGHIAAVLLLVTMATTLLLNLTPGDPAYVILGEQATPQQVQQVHHDLGLDRPFLVRYLGWLGAVGHGDFGTSIRTRQPVLEAISERLPVTGELAALALLLALLASVPLGIYTAYRADGIGDRLTGAGVSLFISSPAFLTGLFLSFFLALRVGIFPVTGWTPFATDPLENLHHVLLPAITLALSEVAIFTRVLRADLIATLQEDFILAARAKGLSTWRILVRHALRPSSFSLVTLAGLSLGRLLGGAVIVETLFALPGVGQLVVQSIITKDLVLVQGIVAFVALAYVVINALVDALYAYLDPRVRIAHA